MKVSKGNYDNSTVLGSESKTEIDWWLNKMKSPVYKQLRIPEVSCRMFTDASRIGWGAILDGIVTQGFWSDEERELHINCLELKAILLGSQSLCKTANGVHIRICTDNSTAVSYINKFGGTQSLACLKITRLIWEWAIIQNNFISAEHIPGSCNLGADRASRVLDQNKEWAMSEKCFNAIIEMFGEVDIDLFASRLNAKHTTYVSWLPDPAASYIDAFSRSWASIKFYAFPPFSLVGKCLQKIIAEAAEGILVVPLWTTQPWFPKLIRMLIAVPVVLPLQVLSLPVPNGRQKLNPKFRVLVCALSGNSIKAKGFRQNQSTFCCHHGEKIQSSNIRSILKNGILSVVDGKLIPCVLMKH